MTSSAQTTRIFIDESGSPEEWVEGLNLEHDKYFTLAAVAIKQPDYISFKKGLNTLCQKYVQYLLGKEIKSRYIRFSNPRIKEPEVEPIYEFYKYPNGVEQYDAFNAELKALIKATEFSIMSVSTNKVKAKELHPRLDIHRTLLSDLWERISIYNHFQNKPKMCILFDPCKPKYDEALKDSYFRFKERGSWYFTPARLGAVNLNRNIYPCDSEGSRGIQLADLCAHPIRKSVEKGKTPFFKEVIKEKLHASVKDAKSGKVIAMGMKISLNS